MSPFKRPWPVDYDKGPAAKKAKSSQHKPKKEIPKRKSFTKLHTSKAKKTKKKNKAINSSKNNTTKTKVNQDAKAARQKKIPKPDVNNDAKAAEQKKIPKPDVNNDAKAAGQKNIPKPDVNNDAKAAGQKKIPKPDVNNDAKAAGQKNIPKPDVNNDAKAAGQKNIPKPDVNNDAKAAGQKKIPKPDVNNDAKAAGQKNIPKPDVNNDAKAAGQKKFRKPDPTYYQGHPQNALEERLAVKDENLVRSGDGFIGKRHLNITGFSIYDEPGELRSLNTRGGEGKLFMSGYLNHVDSGSDITEESVPVKDIGPIYAAVVEWFIQEPDSGVESIITVSTKFAKYILTKPSDDYKSLTNAINRKISITKAVIEYIKDHHHLNPKLKDLVKHIKGCSTPGTNKKMSKKSLLKHAQYVCDQVTTINIDDAISPMKLPCMKKLKKINDRKIAIKQMEATEKNTKKTKKNEWTKATTTPLIRKLFEGIFTQQLDKTNRKLLLGQIRCGVCKVCQQADCGRCSACKDMPKFGGQGHSNEDCKRRICPNVTVENPQKCKCETCIQLEICNCKSCIKLRQDKANDSVSQPQTSKTTDSVEKHQANVSFEKPQICKCKACIQLEICNCKSCIKLKPDKANVSIAQPQTSKMKDSIKQQQANVSVERRQICKCKKCIQLKPDMTNVSVAEPQTSETSDSIKQHQANESVERRQICKCKKCIQLKPDKANVSVAQPQTSETSDSNKQHQGNVSGERRQICKCKTCIQLKPDKANVSVTQPQTSETSNSNKQHQGNVSGERRQICKCKKCIQLKPDKANVSVAQTSTSETSDSIKQHQANVSIERRQICKCKKCIQLKPDKANVSVAQPQTSETSDSIKQHQANVSVERRQICKCKKCIQLKPDKANVSVAQPQTSKTSDSIKQHQANVSVERYQICKCKKCIQRKPDKANVFVAQPQKSKTGDNVDHHKTTKSVAQPQKSKTDDIVEQHKATKSGAQPQKSKTDDSIKQYKANVSVDQPQKSKTVNIFQSMGDTDIQHKANKSVTQPQKSKTDDNVEQNKDTVSVEQVQISETDDNVEQRRVTRSVTQRHKSKAGVTVKQDNGNVSIKQSQTSKTSAKAKQRKTKGSSDKPQLCDQCIERKENEQNRKIKWIGEPEQEDGRLIYYEKVEIDDREVRRGDFVMMARSHLPAFVMKIAYMWKELPNHRAGFFHGEVYARTSDTALGELGDPREVFLCDRCFHKVPLYKILRRAYVTKLEMPADWFNLGGKAVKNNSLKDDGKTYFYSKYYDRMTGSFQDIPEDPICPNELRKHRYCPSCQRKTYKDVYYIPNVIEQIQPTELPLPWTEWTTIKWRGHDYKKGCGIFLKPKAFKLTSSLSHPVSKKAKSKKKKKPKVDENIYTEYYRKSDGNICGSNDNTRSPYCVGYIDTVIVLGEGYLIPPQNMFLIVKVMYRPENTSNPHPEREDLNVVYWSDDKRRVRFSDVVGPCHLTYEKNIPKQDSLHEWLDRDPNRFYFNKSYNSETKRIKAVPNHATTVGKLEEEAMATGVDTKVRPLRMLSVFAGCGGLSEGLRSAGVAESRWAIENSAATARAYSLNHRNSLVLQEDCNIFLRNVMNGQTHTRKGAALPKPGDVELLCGGPPCQGFSGMNRFNTGDYSSFQNSLVATMLAFCDYYRPKYFVFENVRNFVAFRNGMILKLTLRALLAMGYQFRFGVLQAGRYGVPQTRRRLILLAAAPGYVLPLYPEPTHAFNQKAGTLSVIIDGRRFRTKFRWKVRASRRTCTVRDAIGDLPEISQGESRVETEYGLAPQSHYQRMARQNSVKLKDHICKNMAPLGLARISRIPAEPGSDWRDLPNEAVVLSDGTKCKVLEYRYEDKKQGRSRSGAFRGVCACAAGRQCLQDRQDNTLIPWWLPHTANRNNNWAGLYGRIAWNGYFSTTVTDPEPSSKQGRVLHPTQPRAVSVRECARSQGFPDHYVFYGTVQEKYRQIGNAVPPPLAAAIGREIKKAMLARKPPES